MTINAGLSLLLALVFVTSASALNFDQKAALAQMQQDGVECLSGVADDTGFWILTIGSAAQAGKTTKDASDIAKLSARANMAKFFSVQVATAAESLYSESDAGTKESFMKWSREDAQALLAGLKIVKVFSDVDQMKAVALLTQKTIDASAKMKAAMAGGRPNTVEASGQGATKKEAIDAACRSALEQVNGVSAVASGAAIDDAMVRSRAYSDVQGLVSSYRILSEKQVGGQWQVVIVASIDKEELQETYGAQLKSIGDPLFFVSGDNSNVVKLMSDYFIQKGFKTTTNKGTSDYKIELKTLFEEITDPTDGGKGTQLLLTAVCFDKAGVQMFSIENDPRKACSYSGSPTRQTQICVKKAVKQVGKPLHARLQKSISDLVNNGRTVRMIFRNVTTKEQTGFIEQLVTEVNDIPGAGSATSSLNEELRVATLRLTLKGNPQDFVDMLRKRVPQLPPALSVSTNKIVFEF